MKYTPKKDLNSLSIWPKAFYLHRRRWVFQEYLAALPLRRFLTDALLSSPLRRWKTTRPTRRSATNPTSRQKRRPASRRGTARTSPCRRWRPRSVDPGSPSPQGRTLRKGGWREQHRGRYITMAGWGLQTRRADLYLFGWGRMGRKKGGGDTRSTHFDV